MAKPSKFVDAARYFSKVASALLETGARRATLYLSPNFTIRAVRPVYRKHPKVVEDQRYTRGEIRFAIGAPNYAERQFIRKLKLANEPFPVKKVQLKFA